MRPYGWEIFDDEEARAVRRSDEAFRTSTDAWAAGIMVLEAGLITDDDSQQSVLERLFAAGIH